MTMFTPETPLGQAVQTLLLEHPDGFGMLQPGIIHTVTITGTGGGMTQTATAQVFVGGWRVYLPLILR